MTGVEERSAPTRSSGRSSTSTPSCSCPTSSTGAGSSKSPPLGLLADALGEATPTGTVHPGDTPGGRHNSVLLIVKSVALSLRTMTDEDDARARPAAFLAELRTKSWRGPSRHEPISNGTPPPGPRCPPGGGSRAS
ncbi:hypothetical protein LV779_26160 [Streptomyces thinghirensis]|nr:hypothetical protein [Streptomyces thinghirensis]